MKAVGLMDAVLLDSGLYTRAVNPWYANPKLASILAKLGRRAKSQYYVRRTPPWAKARLHFAGASVEQLNVWRRMTEVAKETTGRPLSERIIEISRRLAVGRKPLKRVLRADRTLQLIEQELARRRAVPAVAPAPAPALPR